MRVTRSSCSRSAARTGASCAPTAGQGSLHNTSLGDTVIDPSTQAGEDMDLGDDSLVGGFEDMIRAYTEQRRQLGEA